MTKLIFILLIFLCQSCYSDKANIEKRNEAIALAENFIRDNGYTNDTINRSEIVLELTNFFDTSIANITRRRYNTLHPKAFCYSEDSLEWKIGFLRIEVNLNQLCAKEIQSDLPGRVVRVRKVDKEVEMAHKDPRFSRFKKL